MSRLPNLSLRLRLFLLVLLAIVPLLGLVLYNASQQRDHDLANSSQRAQSAASLVASDVAQRLQGQRELLVTMAQLPAVAVGDEAGCQAAASAILARFPFYSNIGAANPAGDVFCTAIALTQTTNVASRSWFQNAVAGGDFVLGDYQVSLITGRPLVVGAYPVRGTTGAIQGVVFAALDLTQFNTLAAGASLPADGTVTLIDHTGTVLSRNPDPANWVGRNLPDNPLIKTALLQETGTAQLPGLDGVDRLYGFATVNEPVRGLHLTVGIPTAAAFAEVNAGLTRSLIGLGLVAILAFAAAGVVAEGFVLPPVRSLLQLARRFAAGDLAARAGGPYGAGELDELAGAFDSMAEVIQQREAQLEQANRTLRTLSECNKALVRSTDEQSLLEAVCRNVVTFGKYRLAWVDLVEGQTGPGVHGAASAGAEADLPPTPPAADGPASAALRGGQPLVVPLAGTTAESTYPAWREHARSAGYSVLIALPMTLDSANLGVLSIATSEPAGFGPAETQLLTELGHDLAYGLAALRTRAARRSAEAQVAENARRWHALTELDKKLGGVAPHYQALVEELAARTSELVGDATIVTLLSDDRQWLTQAALHHPDPEALALLRRLLPAEPQPVGARGANQVLDTGEAMLIGEVPQEPMRASVPPAYHAYLDRYGVHSLLVVAMRAQGSVIGTLTAARGTPGRPYTLDERDFLQSIADQAALAIANARLYEQIERANAELEQRVAERTAALKREVAERTAAQAEVEDLYNSAPCGYHSLDVNGRFLRVNEYEIQLFGCSREELIGKRSMVDMLAPVSREAFNAEFRRMLQTGAVYNLEVEVRRADDSRVPALISATVVRDAVGNFVMTRSTLIEIVERKQAEARIQALNDTLRQRATELEAANSELEAFSYSVSHDLRAPLRSIDGFSLALMEDYGPQLTGTALDYLQRVRVAAQRMATLIDDLLNLSRVTRSELRHEPVDLSALAHGVAAELQQSEPARQVDFIIAAGLTADGDSQLLGVVLANLLGNAWKFTGRREQARIEFGASTGDHQDTFFVRDNGAGFDMAYVQRLFGAFQRLHGQSEYPGTGIGLATVQRIIHRHGGQVWAEGQPDRGATFYFNLGHPHDRQNHSAD